jgi:hypothetical protein
MRKAEVLISAKREVMNAPHVDKKPIVEIAAMFAAIQLAFVTALYAVGHGAAHKFVTTMGANFSWYLAEPTTMISDGAFICVNKFFENIEIIGLSCFTVICMFALIGSATMWAVAEQNRLNVFQRFLHKVNLRLQQSKISVGSWKVLGILSYRLLVMMYIPIFLLALFVFLWMFGASVGHDSAKEMKALWTSAANRSSSVNFITISADDKIFCGMHIASSPRGHIVWNGKAAMLLPFDSTSFETKCKAEK